MKHSAFSMLCCAAFSLQACVQSPHAVLPRPATPAAITQQLAALAVTAEYGASRAERITAAQHGQALSQSCVRQHPALATCRYYNAVHTGLFHQLHPFGYQKGLARMLADCEFVNTHEPQVGDAGCYRMIGQIFSQLPQTAFRPGHLVRDLDRAATALQTAVRLAPRSFENQLALCEATLALGDAPAARAPCQQAAQLLPTQAAAPGYAAWKTAVHAAQRQLQP